jgi:hypothetical protein
LAGLDPETSSDGSPSGSAVICNLKHVLVGLEMKAALIVPHAKRGKLLFESYFHMLNFEFCLGMFSICEGLGSPG